MSRAGTWALAAKQIRVDVIFLPRPTAQSKPTHSSAASVTLGPLHRSHNPITLVLDHNIVPY